MTGILKSHKKTHSKTEKRVFKYHLTLCWINCKLLIIFSHECRSFLWFSIFLITKLLYVIIKQCSASWISFGTVSKNICTKEIEIGFIMQWNSRVSVRENTMNEFPNVIIEIEACGLFFVLQYKHQNWNESFVDFQALIFWKFCIP